MVEELNAAGLANLHGFGVKTTGLPRIGHLIASADSMAWSYAARRSQPLPGHRHRHCVNCPVYAGMWREQILRSCAWQQLTLDTLPARPDLIEPG